MIKKIKELTVQDIRNICTSHTVCNKKCPLLEYSWLCMGTANMTKKNLEVEISYEPRGKR
jgi:hypothetical protein